MLDDPTESGVDVWKCASSSLSNPKYGVPQTRSFSRDRSMGLPFDPMPRSFGLPGAPKGSFLVYSSGTLNVQLAQPAPSPRGLNTLCFCTGLEAALDPAEEPS